MLGFLKGYWAVFPQPADLLNISFVNLFNLSFCCLGNALGVFGGRLGGSMFGVFKKYLGVSLGVFLKSFGEG